MTVDFEENILKKAAKARPKIKAFLLNSGDRPDAAIPMIKALSPDKIISANKICIIFQICSFIFYLQKLNR